MKKLITFIFLIPLLSGVLKAQTKPSKADSLKMYADSIDKYHLLSMYCLQVGSDKSNAYTDLWVYYLHLSKMIENEPEKKRLEAKYKVKL